MTDQLFDADIYLRNYRKGDPATSIAAGIASSVRTGSQRALILSLYATHHDPDGLTAWDIGQLSGYVEKPGACWWKRVSELVAAGLLEQVTTRRTPTGQRQRACIITDAGRAKVEELQR